MNMSAARLHEDSVVVDAHHPVWNRFVQEKLLGGERVFDQLYAPRLASAGINVVNMVVGTGHTARVVETASDLHFWDTNKILDLLLSEEEEGAETFVLCRRARDIDRALAEEKVAVLTTIAGARPLEGKPNLNLLTSLRNLYRLGLRGVQLTGNDRNRLGDGVGQERTGGGLTRFGVEVVHEMERLGMVIDTAQLSDNGFRDVMEETTGPVVDSHSCARALCGFPRNIGDERIEAIAERGGFVGLSFWAALVDSDAQSPTVEDLIGHVDYVAELVGVEHIALGPNVSGFDTLVPTQRERHPGWVEGVFYGIRPSDYVTGADDVTRMQQVTEALVEHGYSEDDIKKILGGNFLRVYREVLD